QRNALAVLRWPLRAEFLSASSRGIAPRRDGGHSTRETKNSGAGSVIDKDYLILKRAPASRPSGEWNDDDFDVLANGAAVGRIMRAAAAGRQPPSVGQTLKSSPGRIPGNGDPPTAVTGGPRVG